MTRFLRKLFRRSRREDGSATIEFVILFPLFIYVLSSAFDASIMTTRQAMLTGAVDRAVRDLQLGNLGSPTVAQLRSHICNLAGVIPKCDERLSIEMERISKTAWTFRTGKVGCVDVEEDTTPALTFQNGSSNDLMLLTVCAAARPIVPNTGFGLRMPKINGVNGGKYYGIVAMSAYVVEPA